MFFFFFYCEVSIGLTIITNCKGLLIVTVDAADTLRPPRIWIQKQPAKSHNQNASIYDKEKGPEQVDIR